MYSYTHEELASRSKKRVAGTNRGDSVKALVLLGYW